MSTSNDRRADKAFEAIDVYLDGNWGPDIEEQVIDLMVDLHHLLDRYKKKDPHSRLTEYLRVAGSHYEAELCECGRKPEECATADDNTNHGDR